MKNYEVAEQLFEQIDAESPNYKTKVKYTLALMEMRLNKYAEAADHFQEYIDVEKRNDSLLKRAKTHLENCKFIDHAIKNPVPFVPQNLGTNVNTPSFEYLPSLTADESTLVYTARVEGSEDFFMSRKKEGEWQKGKPITAVNTVLNEGAQSISADGKFLVFTACDRKDGYGQCDLYFSEILKGKWTKPKNMGAVINSAAKEKQPSISADGQKLYFASDRKGGKGRMDIYSSTRKENGKWGTPENLGDIINTPANEKTPFIHPDGQTLYFVSDGHPGMGAEDIFLSRLNEKKNWGTPQNLGYPINTAKDEFSLVVSLDGTTAYFASNRIFEDEKISNPAEEVKTQKATDLYSFELYPEIRPQPVTYVKAVVKDAKSKKSLLANVEFMNLTKEQKLISSMTDEDGEFLICLPLGQDYALNVSKEKYLFHSENFALTKHSGLEEPYLLEILLHPIPEGTVGNIEVEGELVAASDPVILKNVFFDTGSAKLRATSYPELNYLVKLLEQNPEIRIQLNGHTDDRGEESDNLDLSEQRAKAVYSYLIEKEIAKDRLRFKGYGESNPIDTNQTEEGRQSNRRTTFVILR